MIYSFREKKCPCCRSALCCDDLFALAAVTVRMDEAIFSDDDDDADDAEDADDDDDDGDSARNNEMARNNEIDGNADGVLKNAANGSE